MKIASKHYLFLGMLLGLIFSFVLFQKNRDLNANIDVEVGGKLVLTSFISGKGDIIVACDPSRHVLYLYEKSASNQVVFRGFRDYTYDILLKEFPTGSKNAVKTSPSPGDVLSYLKNTQYKKDKKWLEKVKSEKLKKKSKKYKKAFREFIRSQCKAAGGATRLLSLEGISEQIDRKIILWDDSNNAVAFYKYDSALGLVLESVRNVDVDMKFGGLGDVSLIFPENLSVARTEKEYEKMKKKRENKDK
jgi:hypothetical protein